MIRSLYAMNGFVAVLLYLPQIRNILKNSDNARSFSLVTFGGWSVGSVITTLYAWTFVRDPMFAAVSLANMCGAGTVFGLVARRRLQAARPSGRLLKILCRRPARPSQGDRGAKPAADRDTGLPSAC